MVKPYVVESHFFWLSVLRGGHRSEQSGKQQFYLGNMWFPRKYTHRTGCSGVNQMCDFNDPPTRIYEKAGPRRGPPPQIKVPEDRLLGVCR